jgi:adenine-specific DNA-methyltransferase
MSAGKRRDEMSQVGQEKIKNLGAFDTPREIAEFLADWAIRDKTDKVLDPGAGTGIFVDAALSRLNELGKRAPQAINQIYAVEMDKERYAHLISKLRENYGITEPKNLICTDFFNVVPKQNWFSTTTGPVQIDAVIGNPPYIERQRFKNVKSIQRRVLPALEQTVALHDVTDIYGYFILHSASFLKEGGRLAFIVSDTWLHMDFGKSIKEYLLRNFRLRAIVGFDKRVFSKVLVRAVLLLVERSSQPEAKGQVTFVQLRDHDVVDRLRTILSGESSGDGWAKVVRTEQESLVSSASWSKYLKGSKAYFQIERNPHVTPLEDIADANIGLQTLRKSFYIFDHDKMKQTRVEREFLEPIALSPRDTQKVITTRRDIDDYVLYCNVPKSEIKSTALSSYIESAEKLKIRPRGKSIVISGVHNIPRIKKAGRKPWYNLAPEIERRCRSPVLVPRRFYTKFYVTWNQAGVVVNEDFINVHPKSGVSVEALLAILNSSVGELACRINGHLYGGGVFDLRPDDVKALPVIDLRQIAKAEISSLENGYRSFVETGSRKAIDPVIYGILQFSTDDIRRLEEELEDLRSLSEISKG